MKSKKLTLALLLAVLGVCAIQSSAEAGSCFSVNLGSACVMPAPRVYESYVVERYHPYYNEPVYLQPTPRCYERPVYIAPRPCYREVVRVYPRAPVCHQGISFSWHCR